ncbi:probable ATP-dependent DNA helicase HFM1 [Lingula anatina]|uniref:Probable ATP-dependent DNA helicase HFM1 n=1 Tax=Lingula anatina TaxID=7574 RepID=A0A1S3HGY3_LINAN|nr:probable ATP-dependent DNA helicase HFM1 [Lingula anatina]|eukprot:XP_013384284.1 probable ATP-dependent DNA helicase HFM1 [Lingula anatina]
MMWSGGSCLNGKDGILDALFYDQRNEDRNEVLPLTAVIRPSVPAPPTDLENVMLSQAFKNTESSQAPPSYTKGTSILDELLPPTQQERKTQPVTPAIQNLPKASQRRPDILSLQNKSFNKPVFKTPYKERSGQILSPLSEHSGSFESAESASQISQFSNSHYDRYSSSQKNLFPSQSNRQAKTPANATFYSDHLETPLPWSIPGITPGGSSQEISKLKSVAELPDQFRNIFPFPYFNVVQSKVFDDVMYTDNPLVVCAPTGAGKTVIFELAIVRLLLQYSFNVADHVKIVYMAPIKALCSERYEDWRPRFEPLGLKCKELTGDTELDDYFELQEVNIIMTTPEKWDSMTRKWRDNKSLVQLVKLFLVDEIHILNDETRGATMEAVISRMKTIRRAISREPGGEVDIPMRFITISATIPNIGDIAEWLSTDKVTASFYKMDDSHRPVKLRKVVLGYPCTGNQSEFRFDLSLNYKLSSVIQTYAEQKPTLVFCATRKSAQQAASMLVKEARFIMNSQHKQVLQKEANVMRDSKLRDLVMCGVGYHHAGLDMQDRKNLESLFLRGELPVLMATSTLAMGVNLPAHLVIIKSTQHYVMGMYEEYSETQILQMIGRAGRPQFDVSATAVIMTRASTKAKYDALLGGKQMIESSLHKHLIEHLNAEVVLNTITDVSVALEWIKSTFLYIRLIKNPKHYGIPTGLNKEGIEKHLQDLCLKNLNQLSHIDLIWMDEDHFDMKPTESGRLMARYCIGYETMKRFTGVLGSENLNELLIVVANCQEFHDIQLRTSEKKTLNTLNIDKNRVTIRYSMEGKIKTKEMKVNCLIQAQLGSLPVQDFGLSQDMAKIFRAGTRVARCLVEFLWQRCSFKALLSAVILSKCFKARLWENSKYVCRQLDGIGPALSNALVNSGVVSFQKVEETNPRELELIVNRHPPFGNNLRDAAAGLPKYEISIEQTSKYNSEHAEISVTVQLTNHADVTMKSTAGLSHTCALLIGDADNRIVYKMRITDAILIKTGTWSKKIEVKRASRGEELSINFVSQEWVGLDVQSTYTPFYTGAKKLARNEEVQKTKVLKTCKNDTPCSTSSEYDVSPNSAGDGSPNNHHLHNRMPCGHRCNNKSACGHECCKFGIALKRPQKQQQGSSFDKPKSAPRSATKVDKMDTYVQSLKQKAQHIPETPNIKRLKMSSDVRPGIGKFAYTPRGVRKIPFAQTPNQFTHLPTATTPHGWDELDFYQQQRTNLDYCVETDNDDPPQSSISSTSSAFKKAGEPQQSYITPTSTTFGNRSYTNHMFGPLPESDEDIDPTKAVVYDESHDFNLEHNENDELPDLVGCPKPRNKLNSQWPKIDIPKRSTALSFATNSFDPVAPQDESPNFDLQLGDDFEEDKVPEVTAGENAIQYKQITRKQGRVFAWRSNASAQNKSNNPIKRFHYPKHEKLGSHNCERGNLLTTDKGDTSGAMRIKHKLSSPIRKNDFVSAHQAFLSPTDKRLKSNAVSPAMSSDDDDLLASFVAQKENELFAMKQGVSPVIPIIPQRPSPLPNSPKCASSVPPANSFDSCGLQRTAKNLQRGCGMVVTADSESTNKELKDAVDVFNNIFDGIF